MAAVATVPRETPKAPPPASPIIVQIPVDLIADPQQPESAKQRVHEVWLDGVYRPAWDPKGPAA